MCFKINSCFFFFFKFKETHLLHKTRCVRIKKSWRAFLHVKHVFRLHYNSYVPSLLLGGGIFQQQTSKSLLNSLQGIGNWVAQGLQVHPGGRRFHGIPFRLRAEGKVDIFWSLRYALGWAFLSWGGNSVDVIPEGEEQWRTGGETIDLDWNLVLWPWVKV